MFYLIFHEKRPVLYSMSLFMNCLRVGLDECGNNVKLRAIQLKTSDVKTWVAIKTNFRTSAYNKGKQLKKSDST